VSSIPLLCHIRFRGENHDVSSRKKAHSGIEGRSAATAGTREEGVLNRRSCLRSRSDGLIVNNSTTPRSRFMDAQQAAEFLGGLNFRTVLRWAREGYLPAIPVGEGKRRLWRFVEADLEGWMLSRRTGTLVPATDAPTRG